MVTKPLITLAPTGNQVLKCRSPRETFSFKPPQILCGKATGGGGRGDGLFDLEF